MDCFNNYRVEVAARKAQILRMEGDLASYKASLLHCDLSVAERDYLKRAVASTPKVIAALRDALAALKPSDC